MNEAPELLCVRGLSKTFPGGFQALKSVDLTLRAGEIHALLGENGAGKSTLIKTVTGITPRDGGEVRRPTAPHTEADGAVAPPPPRVLRLSRASGRPGDELWLLLSSPTDPGETVDSMSKKIKVFRGSSGR